MRNHLVSITRLLAASLAISVAAVSLGQYGTGGILSVGSNSFRSESINSAAPVTRLVGVGNSTVAIRQDGSIFAWGHSVPPQIPLGLTGVLGVAGNGGELLILRSDQTIIGVGGSGGTSTLGNQVPAGLKATQIAVGYSYALALRPDRKVVAWGPDDNASTKGVDTITNVIQIASSSGYYGACLALKSDGTVQAFGPDTAVRKVPIDLKNVTQIAAGRDFAIALKADGTVVGWGDNGSGQASPPAGLTGVVQVAAGYDLAMALKSDGKVVVWGRSFTLPAGLANVRQIAVNDSPTVTVLRSDGKILLLDTQGGFSEPTSLRQIVQIDSEYSHPLYLSAELNSEGTTKPAGKVTSWGNVNYPGSLVPVDVKNVEAVSAGTAHSLALYTNLNEGSGNSRVLIGWGDNTFGQLDFQKQSRFRNVQQVVASGDASYVLLSDGTVKAWGYASYDATKVPSGLTGVTQIAVSNSLVMAVKNDGSVVRWGGYDGDARRTIPTSVKNVVQLVLGPDYALALRRDGNVIGWGDGAAARVPSLLSKVVRLLADRTSSFVIAVQEDGTRVPIGDAPVRFNNGDFDGLVQISGGSNSEDLLYAVSVRADKFWLFQGGSTTATLTVPIAPAVDTDIPITSSSLLVEVPALVKVKAGTKTASFTIKSPGTFEGVATITAKYQGATAMTCVTVWSPFSVSLGLNPATVKGGATVTATANLATSNPSGGVAPKGGTVVTLASDQASVVVPASITIPEGQKSATFNITTSSVTANTTARITAQTGLAVRTVILTVQPAILGTVSLSPSQVKAGAGSTGTVSLDWTAPSGGTVVSLTSSNKAATVPATVTIPAGSTSATFDIATVGVASTTTVTISAKAGTVTKTATLTVDPSTPILASQTLSSSTVKGDDTLTGTVTLDVPALAGGATVTLTSDNAAASVPSTVVVPEGKTTATYVIETNPVVADTNVTITAKVGTSTKASTLKVTAPQLVLLASSASRITGGTASTALVSLDGPAGKGGITVTLTSSDPNATVPVSIIIPEGGSFATFPVTTKKVTTKTRVVLTATSGTVTRTTVLTINP